MGWECVTTFGGQEWQWKPGYGESLGPPEGSLPPSTGCGTGEGPPPVNTEPNVTDPMPVPVASAGRKKALKNYLAYTKWKRKQLRALIQRYRGSFPEQIEAYKTSALGALPEAQKNMWSNMYSNLHQRGLSDSASFIGGAKGDLERWTSGEKSKIADTAQGMEASAQSAILSAIGQPDYSALYSNWVTADNQMASYTFREWCKKTRKC